MDDRSRFKFSAAERTIEIEGSESFVSQQIEQMKDVISYFIAHPPVVHASTPVVTVTDTRTSEIVTATVAVTNERQTGSVEAFPNTFDSLDGALKLIAEVPGDSKKMQAVNAGLIYGYACSLQGKETFPADEVRDICIEHGILDAPNFAKSFNDKRIFIVGGVKGGKKTLKLTLAGKKAALQLIEEIESNAS